MSLKLPPTGHALRELFDVADLAERASPENRGRLPTLKEARIQARQLFAAHKLTLHGQPITAAPVKSINYFILRANGNVQLVTFGPRMGMKVRWNFGQ